jgi:LysM repeat protein
MKRFNNLLIVLALVLSAFAPINAAQAGGSTNYLTQKGDTFSEVAWRYGVSVDRLLAANGLTRAISEPLDSPRFRLAAGQTLVIPLDLGATPSLVNPFVYQVRPKDTLGVLSVRFEIAAWAVVKANGLTDYATLDAATGSITAVNFTKALPVGQTLLIPAGPHSHQLATHETLSDVATLFGVTPAYLLKVNNLAAADLTTGKDLIIPVQYDRPFTPLGQGTVITSAPSSTSTPATTTPAFADPGGALTFRWVAQNSTFTPLKDGRALATFTAEFKGGQAPFKVYVVNWGKFVDARGPFAKTDNGQQWTDLDFDVNAHCGETFLLQVEVHSADGQKAWTIRQFGPVACP